jgi:hypothetical protein
MYFSNLTKEEQKIAPFKMVRLAAFFLAIMSVVAPIYKLNVALPSFDSLPEFSGSIQEFELTKGKNPIYLLKVLNKDDHLTFRLATENMNKKLYKQLNRGGSIKVWYKRDLGLSLNVYQIERNSVNILDYNNIVNDRKIKGEELLSQAYIWFPVSVIIAFLAHLGVIIKSNKSFKQNK